MPQPQTRSLLFEDGSRVFLCSGKQLLIGRSGKTDKKLSADINSFPGEKAFISDLSKSAGIDISDYYQILSSEDDEVEIHVEPDFIVKILPENDQNDHDSRRISHSHTAFFWDGDDILITDPGSGTKLWEGGRRIQNREKVTDGMKIDLISGRIVLQLFLHRDKNGRVYSLRIERLHNYEHHSYLFFRGCITIGPTDSCDIRIAGGGNIPWGKIYVKDKRLGIKPLTGSPQVYAGQESDNRAVSILQFANLAAGAKIMWKDEASLTIRDGQPGDAAILVPDKIEIVPLIDTAILGKEFKKAEKLALKEHNPTMMLEIIDGCPDPKMVKKGLKTIRDLLKKGSKKLTNFTDQVELKQDLLEAYTLHADGEIRTIADECYDLAQKFLRYQRGPKLVVHLVNDEPYVKGKVYKPKLIVTNLGKMSARSVRLKVFEDEFKTVKQDLIAEVCGWIDPDEQIESDKKFQIQFAGHGNYMTVEMILTYLDEFDDEVQKIPIELEMQVFEKDTPRTGPVIYHIHGDYIPEGTKLDTVYMRDSNISTGKGKSGPVNIDTSTIRESNIGSDYDEGQNHE